ncbi:hypothetical protein [Halorubrum sp. Atlit-26R]|uniref:hypothetical protein n=1 Tax=Halorubrum sp. Atlit-26R TaxID=2282128 RepID=UPI000EF24276|nr:hypothetical protein [Halorubrum sp. Atlit-26R]RLM67655.1 hypothetical protein DVK07_12925 [Halorubrum sp. Atlit-26R]
MSEASEALDHAAIRQLIYGLASGDPEDYDNIVDAVHEVVEENRRLREEVAELQELVDPDPGATEYQQLTKPQKVSRVRSALVEEAEKRGGRAALHYDDVKWLFDGHPSAGHCYDLMERAADMDGFAYDRPSGEGGQKRVRVNLDGVNDLERFHAVNNRSTEEGR